MLTDTGCVSPAVLLVEMLKKMRAIQVGETTGQNEGYGEVVAPFIPPSRLGQYQLPVAMILNDRAGLRAALAMAWKGAMSDNEGFQMWVSLPTGTR